jgi:hypothetical protein
MKQIAPRTTLTILKMFKNPQAMIPYTLYAMMPASFLISVAKTRREYQPGDETTPVLEYACKIAHPTQGFFTTENPAPVILAAIAKIIGEKKFAELVGTKYKIPLNWTRSLAPWRGLLKREVEQNDLGALLNDLHQCGCYLIKHHIEEYCKSVGLLPKK